MRHAHKRSDTDQIDPKSCAAMIIGAVVVVIFWNSIFSHFRAEKLLETQERLAEKLLKAQERLLSEYEWNANDLSKELERVDDRFVNKIVGRQFLIRGTVSRARVFPDWVYDSIRNGTRTRTSLADYVLSEAFISFDTGVSLSGIGCLFGDGRPFVPAELKGMKVQITGIVAGTLPRSLPEKRTNMLILRECKVTVLQQ